MDSEYIKTKFLDFCNDNSAEVSLLTIGGSYSLLDSDLFSDLDLFIYTNDDKLLKCAKKVEEFSKKTFGTDFEISRFFLSEGYGLGIRYMEGMIARVEVFVVSETIWKRPPMAFKSQPIWGSSEFWENELRCCKEVASIEYIKEEMKTLLFPILGKMEKYTMRGNDGALYFYAVKALPFILALEEYTYSGGVFEPENVMKKASSEHLQNIMAIPSEKLFTDYTYRLERALRELEKGKLL